MKTVAFVGTVTAQTLRSGEDDVRGTRRRFTLVREEVDGRVTWSELEARTVGGGDA